MGQGLVNSTMQMPSVLCRFSQVPRETIHHPCKQAFKVVVVHFISNFRMFSFKKIT
jgi:hypothetical protein